jgi:hypothetical protein
MYVETLGRFDTRDGYHPDTLSVSLVSRATSVSSLLGLHSTVRQLLVQTVTDRHTFLVTVELQLSELIGTASNPDIQKIRIVGFSLKIGYSGSLNFGCYYLQHVPASKSFDQAFFEVLEAINTVLYCTALDPIN